MAEAGVVNVVTGYGETAGAALAAHPDVDKIAITGSAAVGSLIATAATGNLSLELGGKSLDIVLADADRSAAIAGVAGAVFFNQGECWVAGTRLYVQDSCYDEVGAGVAEIAKSIQVGDGLDLDTQMGPLVSAEQLATVTGYIESGCAEGAKILSGGARRGDRG
jgi:phenylacetaldehyde dehydrogenase